MIQPKRTDLRYLTGWFLPAAKGNHREARRLAAEYRRKHGGTEAAQPPA